MRGPRFRSLVCGALVGAAAALLLDPRAGARRRALTRDKMAHYARVLGRVTLRRARMVPGPIRGRLHAIGRATPWREPVNGYDAEALKHRVESTLGRDFNLPLNTVNFDVVDSTVRIRGTVADEATAERILKKAASVEGVRGVQSLLHTPDGRHVGAEMGDARHSERPRAALQAESVRRKLLERWPAINDADILACQGHIDRLAQLITSRTDERQGDVRAALDEMLMSALRG